MSCRPRPTKSHLEGASKLEIEDALQGRNRERKGGTGNEVPGSRGSTTLSSPKKKAQPFFCYFHFLLFLRASPPPLDKLGRGGGSFQKPSSLLPPPSPTSQGSSSFQQWDPQMKVDIRPPLRYFKPFSPSCVYFYSPPPPYLVV